MNKATKLAPKTIPDPKSPQDLATAFCRGALTWSSWDFHHAAGHTGLDVDNGIDRASAAPAIFPQTLLSRQILLHRQDRAKPRTGPNYRRHNQLLWGIPPNPLWRFTTGPADFHHPLLPPTPTD